MPGWLLSTPPRWFWGLRSASDSVEKPRGLSPACPQGCVPTHKAPPTPNFKAPLPCAGPTWGPLRPAAPRIWGGDGEHPAVGRGAPRGWQAAEISYQQMSAPARGCASGSGCSSAHSCRGGRGCPGGAVAVLGGCGCPGGAMAVLWGRGCPMSQDVMWILLTSSPSPALSILRPGPPSSPQLHPPLVTLPSDVEVTLSTPHPHPVATAEAPPGGFFFDVQLGSVRGHARQCALTKITAGRGRIGCCAEHPRAILG